MKFGVVVFPGSNCDDDMMHVLGTVLGAQVKKLWHKDTTLGDLTTSDCIILPGGFSYGDYLRAGAIARYSPIMQSVIAFANQGGKVWGICNGFQALIRAGVLLADDDMGEPATLAWNESGRFQDRWVHLEVESDRCVFLTGIERMYLPVAHAEGRFVPRDETVLSRLDRRRQLVLRYALPVAASHDSPNIGSSAQSGLLPFPANPNGSIANVAGVCDETGRVFGLMPHPERHIDRTHHPRWTREGLRDEGAGLQIFRNAVAYFG